ncbi:hypothetical protein ACIP98_11905 [Streptomyces sp. NPDC088354]|uniref:hypothetical protein n=1 Tax=unclassified Streptomyces TaxID=2593676 RepID=UPI0029ADEE82|nr:hypothetical protein [Streptomyces sp. MI02-7b]MDX3078220.1 hypothetical protein [Streptomyces sp. MI02-7b]
MAPLPLTLAARLLPTAVLAIVGWTMASSSQHDAATPSAGGSPARPSTPSGGSGSSNAPDSPGSSGAPSITYTKPPAPCTAMRAATIKKLVPQAKTAGKPLSLTDPSHRTGCSWNALKGFDYRWLDVTFEVAAGGNGQSAEKAAQASYDRSKKPNPAQGIGDEASVSVQVTTEDGQQTREAVVVFRKGNAVVTVTYNGSDFESKKAPGVSEVRDGALTAAKDALAGLAKAATSATGDQSA